MNNATTEPQDMHQYFVNLIEEFETKETLENPKDTITLFHGTTTAYLKDILTNGLQPRGKTNISNFDERLQSAKNAVYLTNKWHYRYAYGATESYLDKKYGENWADTEYAWWKTAETLPCYIEIEVPKEILAIDEDIIYQKWFKQHLKSSKKKYDKYGDGGNLNIDFRTCLNHCGTVAVIGGVKPEWIKSFTILGNPELYLRLESSQYSKDCIRWSRGQGCGSKDLTPYLKMEAESDLNGTFWTNNIPKGSVLHQIGINPKTNKIAIVYEKIGTDD